MTTSDGNNSRSVAIEQLQSFGLSTYEARTFVTLVQIGTGTAREVSEMSEVPRTRVYDAAESLHGRGLIEIQDTTPEQYAAYSSETTGRRLTRTHSRRVQLLTDALKTMESPPLVEHEGVSTVDGHEAVSDRICEFLDTAREEILLVTVDDLLTENSIERLRAASTRGVSITVAGVTAETGGRIRTGAPNISVIEATHRPDLLPSGRILLVDRTKAVLSAYDDGDNPGYADGGTPKTAHEMGISGTGEANGLASVLDLLLTSFRAEN